MVSASIVALAAASALFSSVSSHMIMKTPPPIGQPDNSPLLASGANFPCKNPSPGDAKFFSTGTVTNMAVGDTQTLSFTGSAVHGGGSCQLAITKDSNPGPSTSWQVIQSYEGGCPGTASGPATFQYKIPEGVAPGPYIFQWHWQSKEAGQPEYYQNCAKIQVTGGKTKRSEEEMEVFRRQAAALPELFVANLASINSCKAGPGYDPQYPNPGANVIIATGAQLSSPNGTDCVPKGLKQGVAPAPGSAPSATAGSGSGASSAAGAAPSAGSGSGSGSGASSAAGAAPSGGSGSGSGSGASSAAGAAPSGGSGSGSGTTPIAASTSAVATPISVPSSAAAAPSVASSAAGAAPSAASSGSAPTTSGTAGALTGPCTPEGNWNCIGGNSFQRCASGQWSAVTQLAGTQCTPGLSANIVITKRNLDYLLPRNVALKNRRAFVA